MTISATIKSNTKDGGAVELTVEKSGTDAARLTAKNWTIPNPPPSVAPKISDTRLHSAKVSADLNTVTCRADIFGPDPKVVLVLNAPADAPKSVTIQISETIGGLGNSTETYVLADGDYDAIKKFVTDSQFPLA